MKYQPQFQGDEHPSIKEVDQANDLIVLKLRIMSRCAAKDMARHRTELRELQRDHVAKVEKALHAIDPR
jgi:hypothetical protein